MGIRFTYLIFKMKF